MARVVAFIPDLLFASRVQADMRAAGHDVELFGRTEDVNKRLAVADVLVVDLTDDVEGRVRWVESLDEAVRRPQTLGFYSHIDTAARELAGHARFDLVLPRSRMAREGAEQVRRLVEEA